MYASGHLWEKMEWMAHFPHPHSFVASQADSKIGHMSHTRQGYGSEFDIQKLEVALVPF